MTELRPPPWEIGSDFEVVSDSLLLSGEMIRPPPWERTGEPITYLESGRQALTVLSRELRRMGRNHLLMPAYFCDSMIQPLADDDWDIQFVDVDENFNIGIPSRGYDPARAVALTLSYFGAPEAAVWLDHLRKSQKQGLLVVSDETHCVLCPGMDLANYRFASLRKMLPVPDGAYVTGVRNLRGVEPPRVAKARMAAMQAKSEYLHGRAHADYRSMYSEAERLTESGTVPTEMSAYSHRLIRRLDFRRMMETRRVNAQVLAAGIKSSTWRPAQDSRLDFTRSHFVLTGPDIQGLRTHLIEHRVYCPVHWPAPTSAMRPEGVWPTSYLSVPVDHRYSPRDMKRVAHLICDFHPTG